MGYVLHAGEDAEAALHRIGREQIARALAELRDPGLDPGKIVHQVRKRCKKARGLLRLVRGSLVTGYGGTNRWLRDTARLLAARRDADTRLATFDALAEAEPGLRADGGERVRDVLAAERDAMRAEVGASPFARVEERLEAALERIDGLRLETNGFEALSAGLAKTYRRGRRAMAEAVREPSPAAFHAWRKRAKYHGYHLRLLRRAWKPVLQPQREAAERLADRLGLDHDLAVLRVHLTAEPERWPASGGLESVLLVIDRRRAALAAEARLFGRRVYAESPRALTRRIGSLWCTWQEEMGAAGVRGLEG